MAASDPHGEYVGLHSVVVDPEYRGRGYARRIVRELQFRARLLTPKARAIALLAHKPLIPLYESLGFQDLGPSDCQHGDGGWHDMSFPVPIKA